MKCLDNVKCVKRLALAHNRTHTSSEVELLAHNSCNIIVKRMLWIYLFNKQERCALQTDPATEPGNYRKEPSYLSPQVSEGGGEIHVSHLILKLFHLSLSPVSAIIVQIVRIWKNRRAPQ